MHLPRERGPMSSVVLSALSGDGPLDAAALIEQVDALPDTVDKIGRASCRERVL